MRFKEILLGFTFHHWIGKFNWEENVLLNPEISIELTLAKFRFFDLQFSSESKYVYALLLGFGIQYSWL